MGEGICSVNGPEWRFTFTHSIPAGDKICRYIIAKNGETDLGPVKERLRVSDWAEGEAQEMARHCSCVILHGIAKSAADILQSDGERLLREAGVEAAVRARCAIEKEGGTIAEVGPEGAFSAIASAFGWKLTNMGEGIFEVRDCLLCDAPDELCCAMEAMTSSLVSDAKKGFVVKCVERRNPDTRACTYRIGEAKLNMPKAEDDALRTLRMRFARGEISQEQYREMRDVLLGK
jgi:hypothetical protein